jgi:hypothetical protein
MNKHFLASLLFTLLVISLPIYSKYYYIGNIQDPDIDGAVVILETNNPLEEIPQGFSLTTVEEIHAMGYFTPTESKAQARYCSPSQDQPFGSFIHCWIGHLPSTPNDDPEGPIIEESKWVACGGYTDPREEATHIRLRGTTKRDGITRQYYRFWGPPGQPGAPPWWWTEPASYGRLIYTVNYTYLASRTYEWSQFSQHGWCWNGQWQDTNSSVRVTW